MCIFNWRLKLLAMACVIILLAGTMNSHAADSVAPSAGFPLATNIMQLQQRVSRSQGEVCRFRLTGTVLAADVDSGSIFFQDASATVALEMNPVSPMPSPGQQIELFGTNYILLTDYGLSLGKSPVVDNDGLHSPEERSGTVELPGGLNPIRVSWFNFTASGLLALAYQGPVGGRKSIRDADLFRRNSQLNQATEPFVNGLDFSCYEGQWQRLPGFTHLHSVKKGVVTNLTIQVAAQTENVGLDFSGFLKIPTAGTYTFFLNSDDGSRLFFYDAPPQQVVLRMTTLPEPRPVIPGELLSAEQASFWAQTEGPVTFLSRQQDGAELDLGSDANNGLRVVILNSRNGLPSYLLRSRLRVTGICLNTRNADGQKGTPLIEAPNWENVRVLAVAPEHWTAFENVKLSRLTAPDWPEGAITVHVTGRLASGSQEGWAEVRDGNQPVSIELMNPQAARVGDLVECLGRWSRSGTNVVLREAVIHSKARDGLDAPDQPLPVLTTAAQVQQLKREEALRGYPVRLRGVVTWVSDHIDSMVIQDATRAVFVRIGAVWKVNPPSVGEDLEIEGVSDPGDFSPVVNLTKVTRLGIGRMPVPIVPARGQLINGSLDAQYVEISGFVTAVQGDEMTIFTRSGPVDIYVTLNSDEPLKNYVNALVRLRGCLFANWNPATHQVIPGQAPLLKSATLNVDIPPLADPFLQAQKIPVAELLQFNVQTEAFRRVMISAQVLQGGTNLFYAMDDGMGVRFQLAQPADFKPGDIVDVVGFADLNDASPVLREAVARKTGHAPLPPARPLNLNALGDNHDSTLVWVEGTLVDLKYHGRDLALEIQVGVKTFVARLNLRQVPAVDWSIGSRLKLTGVFHALDGDRLAGRAVNSFELLLHSPADVRVMAQPPWWTSDRLLAAVTVLLMGLALTFIWVYSLRRQVGRRTVQLRREISQRERAEKSRAIAQERARIARDLHDDLGSELTEINMMATAAPGLKIEPIAAMDRLRQIVEKSRSMISSLDGVVWVINTKNDKLSSLIEYLASYAEEFLAKAEIACRVELPAEYADRIIEAELRHDVLLSVRETLNNAVRHGYPDEVLLQLKVSTNELEIMIKDNGCGFEPGQAAGNGLGNLQLRMNKLQGTCRIQSSPGTGTTVILKVPLPK